MKKIISFFIIFIISFSLCGCSLFSDFFADNPYGRFEIWVDNDYYEYLNSSAQDFMKVNKLIEIHIKRVDSQNYIENYLINSDTKTEDIPSAVVVSGSAIRRISSENTAVLRDVTDDISSLKSKFTPARLSEVSINKKIYGIPLSSSPVCIAFNDKEFYDYGLSDMNIITWDDMISAGKIVYQKSKGKRVLLSVNKQQAINIFSLIVMQLRNNNDNFNMSIYDTSFGMASNIFSTMLDENVLRITDKNLAPLAVIGTYSDIEELANKNKDDKYIIRSIPTVENGGSVFLSYESGNLVVTEQAQNISGLIEFIKYLSDKKTAIKELKKYNLFPAVTEVYNIKYIDNKYKQFNDDRILSRLSSVCMNEEDMEDKSDIIRFVSDNYETLIGD